MEFVKAGLVFTGEDSPMAKLMLSVMGAFAEFERSLIRERQREGITLAKQRAAYKGREGPRTRKAAELVQRADRRGSEDGPCPRLRDQQGTVYQYLRDAKSEVNRCPFSSKSVHDHAGSSRLGQLCEADFLDLSHHN